MGIAMSKTGAATFLGDHLLALIGSLGPLAVLAGLSALTILLTQAINGAAVATIIAPIAILTAFRIGVEPRSLAMGIALSASMAFITPLGHPVNMLVMGLGGYRFRDYIKIGLPLTLLLFGVTMLLLPVFWPLR
jgi:di/tricarboxylate transporter